MTTIWGIHNNRPEISPTVDSAVRIGWDEMGDLSELDASRDAFKAAMVERIPDTEPGAVPVNAGTLYRFVHEIAVGDIVVSPDRSTKTLNIGTVSGRYEFHPESPAHKHWRPVDWALTGVPRTELSTSAQNEISSLITLFTITTGQEEIEQLLATPPASNNPDFSWAPFYSELADAFLAMQDQRAQLLETLWSVATASGREHLFKYLKTDHRLDGTFGPIRDVDPFTLFGPFNRGIKESARVDIAAAYKKQFDIKSQAPAGFAGIPIVNNLNSWFIGWEEDRKPDDVGNLWTLCKASVELADEPSESAKEALVAAFDACAVGNTRQLTMGIYWIRPLAFAAYDGVNSAYLTKHHPDLAKRLTLKAKISGEEFLANTEAVREWIADPETPFDSIPQLSYAAWIDGLTPKDAPLQAADADAPTSTQGVNDDLTLVGDSYSAESIREEGCFVPTGELETILERLTSKKNLVLQGPPGTGKTWLARRIAWALCNERESERVVVVQFHPSLAYEDFVRGWRPSSSGSLALEDGPFLKVCEAARDHPGKDYVIVVEEINRGNPAQIFGELLTLIEADKRSSQNAMRLAYPRNDNERFSVPANVHIIGTMNVADRSLALVDMALRRRFAFIQLAPAFGDDWAQHVSGLGYDLEALEAFGSRITRVNDDIANDHALGKQYAIGHSFFTPNFDLAQTGLGTTEWIHRVIDTEIVPLLDEYWFDRPELAHAAATSLRGA
nr:AAA family ATPase [Rhodococcus sp. 06-621-2]